MTSAATDRETGTDEPTPSGALSELIREANVRGLSYRKMAARAADPDGDLKLTSAYLQRLVENPPVKPPNPAQLRAIGAALGVSDSIPKRAAAEQWLEYQATELAGYGDEVRIIVAHLAGMTDLDLKRWRAMIEADERARRDGA